MKRFHYKGFIFICGEVSYFDCAHYMTSFDIESLFTNIPLEDLFMLTNFSRTTLELIT